MKWQFSRLWLVFFLFIPLSFLQAQEPKAPRPGLGLALSGGGAKGIAHIGVLKVLEEVGLRPDYISGTSMGSIIGGLYAIGYSPEQIEEIALSLDWDKMISDQISRQNISIEEKEEEAKYVFAFPIVKGSVELPKGLVSGQNISAMLSHLTWSVHGEKDFNEFPVPFRCIATDIERIEPVVLDSGFLPDAIRASMAIPTAFTPVEIGDRLLVDGGVLRNIPASDVKEMGADVIIGVDVTFGLYKRRELNDAFHIMEQATTFQMAQTNEQQRQICDLVISPDIENFGNFDFGYADTLIALGEAAARRNLPRLKALADSLNAFAPPRKPMKMQSNLRAIFVTKVEIQGLNRVSEHVVRGNLKIKDSSWVSTQRLEKGIERVYGTRFFERVSYKIQPEGIGAKLIISVIERSYNYFKVGINYDNHLAAAILLNTTFRNVLGEGSKLLLDLRLSKDPAFRATYSIHTTLRPNIGFVSRLWYNDFEANYYQQGDLAAIYNLGHLTGEFELQSGFSNRFAVSAGIRGESLFIDPQLDINDTVNLNFSLASLYSRINYDNLDRIDFPNNGARLSARFSRSLKAIDKSDLAHDQTFWQVTMQYEKYFSLLPRWVVAARLHGGHVAGGKIHPAFLMYLGDEIQRENNIFPFIGIDFMQYSGKSMLAAGLESRIELWDNKFLLLEGNVARHSQELKTLLKPDGLIYGWGVGVGLRSIIGPIEFVLSQSNKKQRFTGRLKIGYSF